LISLAKGAARRAIILAMHSRRASDNKRKDPPALIRRILVVRPDHLGDLLFATPALRLLRETFPRARITAAVAPWGRPMWANNPDLDALVTIPFPGIEPRREGGPLDPYQLLGRAADALAENNYDLGIVLRFDHWWGAALLWAAGVPQRWGYKTPGMSPWLTNRVPYQPGRHEVEQSFRLAEAVARSRDAWRGIRLAIDRERGLPPLRPPIALSMQDPPRDWLRAPKRVAIHPGTGAANKLWTLQGWAEVINHLSANGWAVALTGSEAERPLSEAILSTTSNQQPVNLAGHTANLNQLVWLFTHADMVLGVDSGPLHIAAALSRPTLHLYGASDETIWGPWGDSRRHRALRAPGTRSTGKLEVGSDALEGGPEMRAITADMVIHEIEDLPIQT
jgi:heptosyltransferase-2/heptosyltransferase-3